MEQLHLDEARIFASLEPYRKKQNMFRIGILLCALPFFSICIFRLGIREEMVVFIPLIFIVMAGGVVVCSIFYTKTRKEYATVYKQVISKPVLEAMFDDARFYPVRGITPEEFRAMHLIKWRNDFRYASEDLIVGTHKNVAFRQADIRITHTEGSGKNRHTVVDVDGRLKEFSFPKRINSNILIVKKGHHASLERRLNKVELEDMDFNDKFDVYAEDEHSVFYLLTPQFMEYTKRMYNHDRAVYISFDGEKLYFLQSGKGGIFEPPSGKLDVSDEVEKARQELEEIGLVIDILHIEKVQN